MIKLELILNDLKVEILCDIYQNLFYICLQVRAPVEHAAMSAENQDKDSDDNAEDEDEGDLDQYRVIPVVKVTEAALPETGQSINGDAVSVENGVEQINESANNTEKSLGSGEKEKIKDKEEKHTENNG